MWVCMLHQFARFEPWWPRGLCLLKFFIMIIINIIVIITRFPGSFYLENLFFNRRPFKSVDSAHGSFLIVRRSFPLLWVLLKSIYEQRFKVGAPSNSILRMGSCIFAAVPQIVMWLLQADNTPTMLQSKETIPFWVVNVCAQSSVDTGASHKDGIA